MDAKYQQGLPTILDVEASGFGSDSYPIEVGLALENGATACFLIRPHHDWHHWDPASEDLHRLTRSQLIDFGRPVQEVALSLNNLLAGKTVYSDAWSYDQGWLNRLFDAAETVPQFRLEALQCLFSEMQFDTWNQTVQQVFVECASPRHRASSDARVIQTAFYRSARQAGAQLPAAIRGTHK